MATILVQDDGSMTVSLTAEEQAMVAMAKQESDIAGHLTSVFQHNLQRHIRDTFELRFARLTALEQADVMQKFQAAKPEEK